MCTLHPIPFKNRANQASHASDIRRDFFSEDPQNLKASNSEVSSDLYEDCPGKSTEVRGDDQCNTDNLENQLKMNIFLISKDAGYPPCLKHRYTRNSGPLESDILLISAIEATLDEVVRTVMDFNVVLTANSKGAELSSSKHRKTFAECSYPCIMPVHYSWSNLDTPSCMLPSFK